MVGVEVTVVFENNRSTITFDTIPTFAQLRDAIAADIVGSESFSLTGITARGSSVPIKDSASFTRVLGPRREVEVLVIESLATSKRRPTGPAGCTCEAAFSTTKDVRAIEIVGKTLWTAEKDSRIVLRNAMSGTVVDTAKLPFGSESPSNACLCLMHVKLNEDGSKGQVWAGFQNKSLVVFNSQNADMIKLLQAHSGAVVALASTCGFVFSASVDFTILQWNPLTLAMRKLLAKHANAVRCLCVSHTKLFSGSDDRSIIIWSASTGEPQKQLQNAHTAGVHAIAFIGGNIWTGGEDGAVRVWSSSSLELVQQFFEHTADITALHRLETRIISLSLDRKMVLYDALEVTTLGSILHPHDAAITCIASAPPRLLFRCWTGSQSCKLCRWAVEDVMAPIQRALSGVKDPTTRKPAELLPQDVCPVPEVDSEEAAARQKLVVEELRWRLSVVELQASLAQEEANRQSAVVQSLVVPADRDMVEQEHLMQQREDLQTEREQFRQSQEQWQRRLQQQHEQQQRQRGEIEIVHEQLQRQLQLQQEEVQMQQRDQQRQQEDIQRQQEDMQRQQEDMQRQQEDIQRQQEDLQRQQLHREQFERSSEKQWLQQRKQFEHQLSSAAASLASAKEEEKRLRDVCRVQGSRIQDLEDEIAASSHRETGRVSAAAAVGECHLGSKKALLDSHLQIVAEMKSMFAAHRREFQTQSVEAAQTNALLVVAQDELDALHLQYDQLYHDLEKKKRDLQTSENTRINTQESARRCAEEIRLAHRRESDLQAQMGRLAEESAASREQIEREMRSAVRDIEVDRDRLKQELIQVQLKCEKAEREERRTAEQLRAAVETVDAMTRRADQSAKDRAEEESRIASTAASDRAKWQAAITAAQEELEITKREARKEVLSQRDEINRLAHDARELAQKQSQIVNENETLQRRLAGLSSESEKDGRRLVEQLEEARSGWKAEVQMLEQALAEKESQISTMKKEMRDAEAAAIKQQTALTLATRNVEAAQEENSRLKENISNLTSSSERSIAGLEASLSSMKADLESTEKSARADRHAKLDAERRLKSAEDNYETVRRRQSEQITALKEECVNALEAERLKRSSVETSSSSHIEDLNEKLNGKIEECSELIALRKEMEEELAAARDKLQQAQRSLQLLQAEVRGVNSLHASEVSVLSKRCDSREGELQSVLSRHRDEIQRLAAVTTQKDVENEDLRHRVKQLDLQMVELESALESSQRQAEDAAAEIKRLNDSSAAERAALDERQAASAGLIESLRSELSTARQKIQDSALESEKMSGALQDAQSALSIASEQHERTVSQLSAQVQSKDTQLQKLHAEKRSIEKAQAEHATEVVNSNKEIASQLESRDLRIEALQQESQKLVDEIAALKEEKERSSERAAKCVKDRDELHQRAKADWEVERSAIIESTKALQQQLADSQRDNFALRHEQEAARDAAARDLQGSEEHRRAMASRVQDLERQLEAKAVEITTLRQQTGSAMEQQRSALEGRSASLLAEKDALAAALKEAKQQEQAAEHNLSRAHIELAAAREAEDKLRRELELEQHQHASAVQRLRGDLDSQKKLAAQRKAELEEYAARQQRELEAQLESLAERRAEHEAATVAAQTAEMQMRIMKLDVEKEQRASEELRRENQRLQDRVATVQGLAGEQDKDRQRMIDDHRRDLSAMKDELQRRTAEWELEKQARVTLEDACSAKQQEIDRVNKLLASATSEAAQYRTAQREHLEKQRVLTDRCAVLEAENAHTVQELEAAAEATQRTKAALMADVNAASKRTEQLQKRIAELQRLREEDESAHAAQLSTLQSRCRSTETTLEELRARQLAEAQRAEEATRSARGLEEQLQRITESSKEQTATRDAELASERDALRRERRALGSDSVALRHASDGLQTWITSCIAADALLQREQLDLFLDAANDWASSFADSLSVGMKEANEEVSLLAIELARKNSEIDRQRNALGQSNDLISETREELTSLYARYKRECDEHKATQIALMKLESALTRGGDMVERLHRAAIESEKEVLRGHPSSVDRQSPLPANSKGLAPCAPHTAFVMTTRGELMRHIAEIVRLLHEAARHLAPLGNSPPLAPSMPSLVDAFGQVSSARSRGDLVLSALFTENERQSISF